MVETPSPRCEPAFDTDGHGEAALLLAESILHCLLENSVLSLADALSVVRTAVEVKLELALENGVSEQHAQASLTLLNRIAESLRSAVPS